MPNTPVYGLPYQGLGDPPNGADLGEDGFLAVEAELVRIDAAAAVNTAAVAVVTPISTAWTDWTVVWTGSTTNPVIGNGSITGRYKIVGKFCVFWFNINLGATTTVGSGTYAFSWPPGVGTVKSGVSFGCSTITAAFRDNSAAVQSLGFGNYGDAATTLEIRAGTGIITPTIPYTFAASDFIRAWGIVEIS